MQNLSMNALHEHMHVIWSRLTLMMKISPLIPIRTSSQCAVWPTKMSFTGLDHVYKYAPVIVTYLTFAELLDTTHTRGMLLDSTAIALFYFRKCRNGMFSALWNVMTCVTEQAQFLSKQFALKNNESWIANLSIKVELIYLFCANINSTSFWWKTYCVSVLCEILKHLYTAISGWIYPRT